MSKVRHAEKLAFASAQSRRCSHINKGASSGPIEHHHTHVLSPSTAQRFFRSFGSEPRVRRDPHMDLEHEAASEKRSPTYKAGFHWIYFCDNPSTSSNPNGLFAHALQLASVFIRLLVLETLCRECTWRRYQTLHMVDLRVLHYLDYFSSARNLGLHTYSAISTYLFHNESQGYVDRLWIKLLLQNWVETCFQIKRLSVTIISRLLIRYPWCLLPYFTDVASLPTGIWRRFIETNWMGYWWVSQGQWSNSFTGPHRQV